jgi:hypothetical protein
MKSVVISAAALAVIGGATAGIGALATASGPAQVQLAAVGIPLPQDPPPPPPPPLPPAVPGQLPSPDQLAGLCIQVTDPGVSYTTKNNLVENGIAPDEGHVADHDLRKAYRNGNFPETFTVTNIVQAGPNVAAQVAIAGPKFAGPVSKQLVFVNQGGNWVLQHDAAIALVQAASATG